MLYLTNGLSVHMLEFMCVGEFRELRIERISLKEVRGMLRSNAFQSYFGHKESVETLSRVLRVDVPYSRNILRFRKGDIMIIATLCSRREWEQDPMDYQKYKFYLVEYLENGKSD